jgi:hypothetical protein
MANSSATRLSPPSLWRQVRIAKIVRIHSHTASPPERQRLAPEPLTPDVGPVSI